MKVTVTRTARRSPPTPSLASTRLASRWPPLPPALTAQARASRSASSPRTITGTVKVFASIDGKAAEGESFPYTGEAYTPSVVVKAGKKVLTAGEDYTVSYRVKGEKDEIESMVEPEDYQIVVSFPGTGMSEETVDFTIDKATIKSVKPASPVYAYTGEAIKPDFVGYTGAKGTGTEVALPNSAVGVKSSRPSMMTMALRTM